VALKRTLDDDSRNRLALLLDVIGDRLAEVEGELAGSFSQKNRPRKAVRRALAAVDTAGRALDRQNGKGPSLLLDLDGPNRPSL
jgi:hypothetical protein